MPADYDGDKLKVWEQDYEPFIGYSDGGATVEIVYLDGIKVELFAKGLLGATLNFVALAFIAYMVNFVHSGSLWITFCSGFAILCAAVWGFVFNEVFFRISFFPLLNLVALFLIMGVGADDIFVYIDTWRQSFTMLPRNSALDQRLSWTNEEQKVQ